MKNTILVFGVVGLLVGSVAYGSWWAWRQHAGDTLVHDTYFQVAESGSGGADVSRRNLPPGKPATPFQLTERSGKPFDSASMKGDVWVASFFYTSCPAECFRMNQGLAGLQEEKDLRPVKFVSITCDPDDDTPETLRKYAERFDADPKRWFFLTGDIKKIIQIGMQDFMLPVEAGKHSKVAVILDRQSCVRGFFNMTEADDVNAMRTRLLELLAEPSPAAAGNASPANSAKSS